MNDSMLTPGGACCRGKITCSGAPVVVAALTAVALPLAPLAPAAYAADLQAFEVETMSQSSDGGGS
jgi:hypothetical protein